MLIEKRATVAANDIVALRLVTGEELIAKATVVEVTESGGTIVVTKPVVVQMQMISAQQAGIGFAPFMVSVDEDSAFTFTFDKLALKPLKASADMTKRYIQMTTGIEIPKSGLVV